MHAVGGGSVDMRLYIVICLILPSICSRNKNRANSKVATYMYGMYHYARYTLRKQLEMIHTMEPLHFPVFRWPLSTLWHKHQY